MSNPGFEAADLSAWDIDGSHDSMAEVVGHIGDRPAVEGVRFGAFTTTDELQATQAFSGEAGQVLRGWAFFRSSNGRSGSDAAHVRVGIDGTWKTVFAANTETLNGARSTPWIEWEFVLPASGEVRIEVLVDSDTICAAPVTLALDGLELIAPPTVVAAADAYTVDAARLVIGAPGILSNDSDPDGGGALSAELVDGPAHGTLTLNADGSFTYEPNAGYAGTDAFTYAARDHEGNRDEGTVTLTVVAPPQPAHPVVEGLEFSAIAMGEGETLSIEGRVSNPRGLPQTVTIDWGDGASVELELGLALSFEASHRYEHPGTYAVQVTPHDDAPGMAELTEVFVTDVLPSVNIAGAGEAGIGASYLLELRGREGQDEPITAWRIDWGDGTVETLEGHPSEAHHTYASGGTYPVRASALVGGEWTAAPYAATRLDRAFGDDGVIVRDFGFSETLVEVLRDAQGRLVTLGTVIGGWVVMQRYHADGSLDESFGDEGTMEWREGHLVRDGAILPDGTILIVATKLGGGSVLARFREDGSFDRTLGSDDGAHPPTALTVVGGDRIVVAGEGSIRRYELDGTLDTAFGTDGTTQTGLTGVREVIAGPDGAILANGFRTDQAGLHLVRLHPDGAIDAGFGDGGYVRLPLYAGSYADGGSGGTRALEVAPDGRIVIGGRHEHDHLVLARLNEDGTLDETFGAGGVVRLEGGSVTDLELRDDGRIVAVGSVSQPELKFALFSFEADGRPDVTFGDNGIFMVEFLGVLEQAHAMLTFDDGSILAAGIARPAQFDFAIAKVIAEETQELTVIVS